MPKGPRSITRRAALSVLVVVALTGSLTVASGRVAAMDALTPAPPPVPVVAKAADAGSALAAAMRQGSRVEVTGEGTDTRTVYANPDGTNTAELTAVPTRVKRGNQWVGIDYTLAARPDGSVGPKAAPGDGTMSGGGRAMPLLRLAAGPTELALHWPDALPTPVLSGNQATYPEVLPGVDLVMRVDQGGFQQLLVIKSREAARNPALAEVGLRVVERGLHLSADEAGALRVVDDAGRPVYESPPSVMWDSSAASRWAPVVVRVAGGVLTLVPDQEFLADPATVYPVTVDPREQPFGTMAWATVVSGKPTTPYFNKSADPFNFNLAQVGQCYTADGRCNGIREARAYLRFETAFLGDKDVIWAKFFTSVVYSPKPVSHVHQLHVVHHTEGISEHTSFANQPGSSFWTDFQAPPARGTEASVELGLINASGTVALNGRGATTFNLRAKNGADEDAWRKYNPDASKTRVVVKWNRPPNNPRNLHTDPPLPAPCKWCDGTPYVSNDSILLKATLDDPDGDWVFPRWRIAVQDREVKSLDGTGKPSGSLHDTPVDLAGLHNKWVGWWVHADDTDIYGHGRASGLTSGQTFMVDRQRPTATPVVDSAAYPSDNAWHGGAGSPGVFTFKPGAPCDAQNTHGVCDIDHYLYSWNGGPPQKVDADSLGGNATVTLVPPGDGAHALHVQSVDRARHRSEDTAIHHIRVRAGNGPRSLWSFEGNPRDTAFLGNRHGAIKGGASYGPGAVGTALRLDGTDGTIATAPSSFRTDASFSVSAWVRPDELSRSMTPLSQDGATSSAWFLDYSHDQKTWSFLSTGYAAGAPDTLTARGVRSRPGVPTAGEWTHLTGVYDRPSGEMRLYVNGVRVGTQNVAGFTPQVAAGQLTVGRVQWDRVFGNQWLGSVDEVGVYDRVLSDAEVTALVGRDNVRTGHWAFDDKDGAVARNSVAGGVDGELRNGATLTAAGLVGGAVAFDGRDDHVATRGPVVRTDQSFSVSAWVRPNQGPPAGQSMTVVSQDGAHPAGNSGFYLQWNGAGPWMFIMAGTETGGSQWHGSSGRQLPRAGEPMHLTGVYDATTRTLLVYVNGEAGYPETLPADAWNATGPLVVGRAKGLGSQVDFFNGLIDDVRTYNRALAPEEIAAIQRQSGVSNGSWKLDGNTNDSSGRNLTGTWSGSPSWTDGRVTDPDTTNKAALLTGSNGISADNAIDTRESFTVAAWVRPDAATGCHCTIVSQDAAHSAGFALAAGGEGEWVLHASSADPSDRPPPGDWAMGDKGQVQAGEWTHVAGVYDRRRGSLDLYVNGARVKTTEHKAAVHASGPVQIGRTKAQGWPDYVNNFVGAIDDVKLYNRALFADEIRELAGRDLSLVHNWRFNNTATDSIGSRGATLQGAQYDDAGRAGASVRLDGTDDAVTTTGVDLRTDQSFTVSTWVKLSDPGPCAGVCRRNAVGMQGASGSGPTKFRLGHRIDTHQAHWPGKWVFEMPELATGRVTEAAISMQESQFNTWVLLVGTYNAATGTIELYVYTDENPLEPDYDTGRLSVPWRATGGLQVGRTVHNGVAGEYWPGGIDDVRLYTGNLSAQRIKALYDSYPRVTS